MGPEASIQSFLSEFEAKKAYLDAALLALLAQREQLGRTLQWDAQLGSKSRR